METDEQEKHQDKKIIIVIDDEAVIREGMRRILSAEGHHVETSAGGRTAIEKIQEQDFDVVVTDLKMPGMDGLEVLKTIKILQPEVPVIMITGYSTVSSAVEAMKNGAFDYIAKPFTPELIIDKVQKAIDHKTLTMASFPERQDLGAGSHGFDGLVGKSAEMQKVYRRILQVAPTDSTVLITGESGTGKELAARAIHKNSLRREQFGHVKGSFTGAIHSKMGLFKVADGGTLFLDDISNISLTTQAKLLRVLQERVLTPISDTRPIPTDIRLVVATNIDLHTMVTRGSFREDLFFRINVIPIYLPPLRERKGDLPLIILHFLQKYSKETGKDVRGLAPAAVALLKEYKFPGNVRELENIIERSVVLCNGDMIQKTDLELRPAEEERSPDLDSVPFSLEELKETKKQLRVRAIEPLEKAFVIHALKRNNWNVSQAAEETGMLRPNFHALLKKLGISVRDAKNGES
jgi:DNA-binding NtrC family response regulator